MVLAVNRGFNLRSVNVVLGVDEVVVGQIFLQVGLLWHSSKTPTFVNLSIADTV
jgi:hypothetical protein